MKLQLDPQADIALEAAGCDLHPLQRVPDEEGTEYQCRPVNDRQADRLIRPYPNDEPY